MPTQVCSSAFFNQAGKLVRTAVLATGLAILIPFSPVNAQETVVARVGDTEITERELAFAEADLAQQFAQVPESMRKAAILSALIDIVSLSKKAKAEGHDNSDAFKARMAFLRSRALHNQYFQTEIAEKISDEEVKARFDKEIAALEPEKEVKARHILVKTEEEAKKLIAEIEGGADFAELAKEHSTGPTGANGGDLGFSPRGRMVPEFEDAIFGMKDGEFTKQPVKTQFGWHVILREAERDKPAPKFEEVEAQIRQVVLREKYFNEVQSAKDGIAIEILDADLKKQVEEARQPAAQ